MDTAQIPQDETAGNETEPQASANRLVLPSLEIKNFRAFRHLTIEKLGRVNLITGKNNVGKTSLLEALWLYAERGSPYVIRQILFQRGELNEPNISSNEQFQDGLSPNIDANQVAFDSIKFLFHGRILLYDSDDFQSLTINPLEHPQQDVSITLVFMKEDAPQLNDKRLYTNNIPLPNEADEINLTPYLAIGEGGRSGLYKLDRVFRARRVSGTVITSPYQMIRASSVTSAQINSLWDGVALTPLEEEVVTSLRLLASGIERLNLIGTAGNSVTRVPYVKMKGDSQPIPLRSLGDGSVRLFGMTLALFNAKGPCFWTKSKTACTIPSSLMYGGSFSKWPAA